MKKTITFFKSLLLVVMLLVGSGSAWGQYSGAGTFTKITSLTDLTDGYYVILNETDGFVMTNGRSGSATTGYFVSAAISVTGGSIINPSTNNVWKIETNGSGKTIYNETIGKYVGWSSGNAASIEDAPANTNRWTFTYASSKFTVKNVATTSRQLSYNSGSPRFAAYANADQHELQLYKMAATCTAPTFSFASATVNKLTTDAAFTNAFTSNNTSTKVWSSTNEAVATVDSNGEVTIVGAGSTNIRVNQAADATYCAVVDASYALTVTAPGVAEPTNQPTSFTATTNSTSQITVTWADATGTQLPEHYLVKASTGAITAPVDGTAEADAALVQNIAQGTQTAEFKGLNASTTYNFSIWPYTNSGAAIDYKTDGTVATASATTEDIQYPNVIITEVFGGGGNSGATLKNDFIELYNTTNSPIDISGWSIQYYSATGTTPGTDGANVHVIPSGSIIPAKSTFLVQEVVGSGGSINLYEPDVIGTLPLSGTNGKVVLYTTNTAQTVSTSDITSITANIYFKDYLPYGNATPTWGSSTSALSNTTSATRKKTSENYVYTQNIGNDFEIVTPTPQNSGKFRSKNSGAWSNTSTWEFTDNGTWVDATSIPTGVNSKAEISNGHEVNVASSGASSALNINPTAKLTVNTGSSFTAPITIQSDANGTGTIVGDVSGAATVNQYLKGDYRTWYLSSPVANAQPANLGWIKYYNEADGSWPTLFDARTSSAVAYGSNSFITAKGYLVVPSTSAVANANIQFVGELNTGNKSIALTNSVTTNTSKPGFNLVGNPYPSYLKWADVYAANSSKLSSASIWYRTKQLNEYVFWTVNGEDVVTPLGVSASSNIPPMQAFWVKTTAGGGTLELTNNMRSHANATGFLLKAPAVDTRTLIRLQVSNGTNTDEAVLYLSDNANNGLDAFDAPKMSNDNASIAEIFTRAGNEKLVINAMRTLPRDTEITLGFEAGSATSFTLRANELSNLPSDVKLILKDNVTKAETDLTDGTAVYSFSNIATSGDRFSIIFRTAGAVTGIDQPTFSGLTAYSNANNQLTVLYDGVIDAHTVVSVYNAVGQRLVTQSLKGVSTVIDGEFAPGVYVVKVNNLSRKLTIKN